MNNSVFFISIISRLNFKDKNKICAYCHTLGHFCNYVQGKDNAIFLQGGNWLHSEMSSFAMCLKNTI